MIAICSGDFPWTPCRLLKGGSCVTRVLNLRTVSHNMDCFGQSHHIYLIVFFSLDDLNFLVSRSAACHQFPAPRARFDPVLFG
jgi:hypothetical protein